MVQRKHISIKSTIALRGSQANLLVAETSTACHRRKITQMRISRMQWQDSRFQKSRNQFSRCQSLGKQSLDAKGGKDGQLQQRRRSQNRRQLPKRKQKLKETPD